MSKTSVKQEKWEMHTLDPRLWRVYRKPWKVRNRHCRIWNMTRNTEKREKWEMHTVDPGEWWENWKSWKIRNKHCRTWIMARNTQKLEKEKYTEEDLYYSEKTEKHGIWDKITVWRAKWRKTLKMAETRNAHCRTWIWQENLKS